MPAGTIQKIIACVPKVPNTGVSTAPCATQGVNRFVPAMQDAFVVDPSLEQTLTAIQNANNGSIDYAAAGTAFGAAFILVVTLYVMAKPIGALIRAVR